MKPFILCRREGATCTHSYTNFLPCCPSFSGMMFCACIPQHTLLFPSPPPPRMGGSEPCSGLCPQQAKAKAPCCSLVRPSPPCNLPRIAQEGAVVCVSVGGGEGGGMDGRALTREFSFHPPLYVFPRPARASHSSLPLLTNMHREGGRALYPPPPLLIVAAPDIDDRRRLH